jgi:hypothetical protein
MQNMPNQTVGPAIDESTPATYVKTEQEAIQSVSI